MSDEVETLPPEVLAEHFEEVKPRGLVPVKRALPDRRMSIQEIAQQRPQAIEAFTDAMRTAALQQRRSAFAVIDPEDFVLNRDKEGNETGMLSGPGCLKIAPLLGLKITNLRGPNGKPVSEPVIEVDEKNGKHYAVIIGDAHSAVTDMTIEALRAERGEGEDFTGRKGNMGDLKSSVMTLLLSKAVRQMTGMVRVPIAVMQEHDIDTDRCRRGHGYGSSQGRQQAQATGADAGKLETEAKALWDDMLRVGGDEAGAMTILKVCSAFKGSDGQEVSASGWERLIAKGKRTWLDNTRKEFDRMHPEGPE